MRPLQPRNCHDLHELLEGTSFLPPPSKEASPVLATAAAAADNAAPAPGDAHWCREQFSYATPPEAQYRLITGRSTLVKALDWFALSAPGQPSPDAPSGLPLQFTTCETPQVAGGARQQPQIDQTLALSAPATAPPVDKASVLFCDEEGVEEDDFLPWQSEEDQTADRLHAHIKSHDMDIGGRMPLAPWEHEGPTLRHKSGDAPQSISKVTRGSSGAGQPLASPVNGVAASAAPAAVAGAAPGKPASDGCCMAEVSPFFAPAAQAAFDDVPVVHVQQEARSAPVAGEHRLWTVATDLSQASTIVVAPSFVFMQHKLLCLCSLLWPSFAASSKNVSVISTQT